MNSGKYVFGTARVELPLKNKKIWCLSARTLISYANSSIVKILFTT